MSLVEFKGLHQNHQCFILGAGVSLPEDISFIKDEDIVISVNSSILLTEWNNKVLSKNRFWLSNDSMCLKWDYFPKVLLSECTRIYRESWAKHVHQFKKQSYHFFKPRNDEYSDEPLSSSGDLCSVSSVPSAIDFAIWMGCNPIRLLGVDQVFCGYQTHFWHRWHPSRWPRMNGRVFDHSCVEQKEIFAKNEHSFKKLQAYAQLNNVQICNCSPISTLTVFEKIDLCSLET